MHPGDVACFLNSLRRISEDVEKSSSLEEGLKEEILSEVEAMKAVLERIHPR